MNVICQELGIPEEIWNQIVRTDECWIWTGEVHMRYGRIRVNGGISSPHRLMYEIFKKPIKSGMEIHHKCENTICCNPRHLRQVSQATNRRLAKGWTQRNGVWFCKAGHEMTRDNLVSSGSGFETCSPCKIKRNRSYRW